MKKTNSSDISAQATLHLFPFDEADYQKILSTALSRGGWLAEIFLEYTRFYHLLMEDDIIKETDESIRQGAGLRVLEGEKAGFAYTNDFKLDSLLKAAQAARAIVSSPPGQVAIPPLQQSRPEHSYYLLQGPMPASLADKIKLVKQTYYTALQAHPRIKKVRVSLVEAFQQVALINSDGLIITDARPMIKLVCLAIAEAGSRREAGFAGDGGRVDLSFLDKHNLAQRIGQEAAEEALLLLEARPAPAGEMPVVLAPGQGGVLLHEAVGHLLEADFIRKKTSIFWNKLDQIVAAEQVTIIDDPTIPRFRGSYNIDDEGTLPQKTYLIQRGRVVGFLQDRLSARLLGQALTGHGRREDYSHLPLPRMSNTYLDQGEYAPEEIIRSIKKGLYARRFQGGQVEDSGKFTFSLSSAQLIEDGKLTVPLKQVTLIGSNLEVLRDITMVGHDLAFSHQIGSCGKEGQTVPVTDGCPTVKIKKLTVGGAL
ncbi:TldD/PmbA family protein [Candidatus Aminicenantes bacterium AC-334-K16]|jgi:TldD protein|nr:TldD/PmbA family protein [Candidatus Aminicenantes bacterium AC-334-K16]